MNEQPYDFLWNLRKILDSKEIIYPVKVFTNPDKCAFLSSLLLLVETHK
jgi:hypothetical protein